MQRFRLRAAAILIAVFLPALGVCASLSPPSALLSFCSAEGSAADGCCGGGARWPCPAPDRAPTSPRCRACEGLLAVGGEERPALRIRAAAPPLPASVAVGAPTADVFCPDRLRFVSASPPLLLLNESLRN